MDDVSAWMNVRGLERRALGDRKIVDLWRHVLIFCTVDSRKSTLRLEHPQGGS